jgi:NAD(P)-dependent dehydrogenase (short-subunit alcohol dehydrogenase family)
VHLARTFLPAMISGGGGRFVVTASAAGLLTSPGDCPYVVTKHAAVAFAEWLSIHHGHQGIDVSVICPQGVATPLLASPINTGQTMEDIVRQTGDILSTEDVADMIWQSIVDRKFLILPHPEVAEFVRQKAFDTDTWIVRMRRFILRS